MRKKVLITVKGRVQRVFFRVSAARRAEALGIRGQVENLDDGSVKIVAEGTEENLEGLIDWCREGSPRAVVESVDVEWSLPDDEFRDFRVM